VPTLSAAAAALKLAGFLAEAGAPAPIGGIWPKGTLFLFDGPPACIFDDIAKLMRSLPLARSGA
jgi:hypothetical protein